MDKAPYSLFAKYYDEIMEVVDYQMWTNYLLSLLRVHRYKARTILDLACGTGNMSYLLADLGFKVIGLDKSSEMLIQARKKQIKHQGQVEYYQGDMRDFKLDEKQDLIICLYDSINYLLSASEIVKAFSNIKKALQAGGLFVFDFNTCHRIKRIAEESHLYEGDRYICLWRDSVNQKECIWQVELEFLIQGNDEIYRRYKENHQEKGYSLKEMKGYLKEAGLEVLASYRAYSLQEAQESDGRIYIVSSLPL